MVAQSIARRTKRQQQVEADDAVLARALEFTEWARKNIKLIVTGGIVLALALSAFFWYRADRAGRLDRAAIAFIEVEQAVSTGDPSIAARDLQQYIQRHEGTPYADEARVMLAQVHLQAGEAEQAVAALEPVVARMERSRVGAQAGLLLGVAQLQAGNRDAAIAAYLEVANRADESFRREEALASAALLRMEAEDHAGAAELYSRLVDMNPTGSPRRSLYEMRLAEAEALARTN